MRAASLALLLALIALVGRDAIHTLTVDVRAAGYPFELDYGEGPLLAQTMALTQGRPIYVAHGGPPYQIANYPPVYHFVTRGLAAITRDTLLAGRTVSLASAVLIAIAIALLVSRGVEAATTATTRRLAAVFAALYFLRVANVAYWAPLMRVDMLAILFSLAGVIAFVSIRAPRAQILGCAALLVLAAFTKQSAVAAAGACIVAACFAARSLAIRLTIAYVAIGAVALAFALVVTEGLFWFHVVTANANEFDRTRVAAFFQDVVRSHPVAVGLALFSLLRLMRVRAGDGFRLERPVLGLYLLGALAVAVSVGKIGSDVNYMIEPMAIVCCCLGVFVADWLDGCLAASHWGTKLAAVALPALLLFEVTRLSPAAPQEWAGVRDPTNERKEVEVLARIRAVEGPILSENMTLLVLAGRRIEYQPFEMTQLARQGVWDPSPFLRSLRSGFFALIVLGFDIASPPAWELERFSPAMIDAIREAYEERGRSGAYRFYEPRQVLASRLPSG